MKKLLYLVIYFSLLISAYGQPANTNSPNTESGVFVLYYGNDNVIENCMLYACSFFSNTNEEVIAEDLRSRISAVDPYIGFKYLGGYDCANAKSFLRKKGIGEFNMTDCLSYGYDVNGEIIVDHSGMNSTHYWDNPDNITDERVNQLDTYGWALVNSRLTDPMTKLESDGWQKVYEEYNLAGGYNSLYLGKELNVNPDWCYIAIGTVMDAKYYMRWLNFDKLDADGIPFEEDFVDTTSDKFMETNVFYPKEPIKRLMAALISEDKVNTTSAGLIIYRKKYDMQAEFQSILDDAKNDFTSFKMDETKDPNGVVVFLAKEVFRLQQRIVFQTEKGKWMFSQFCKYEDPYEAILENDINSMLSAYAKTGNYTTDVGDFKGETYYRLLDKDQKLVFQMVKGEKQISLNFFGNSL